MRTESLIEIIEGLRSEEHFLSSWTLLHEKFWAILVRKAMDRGLSGADAEDVSSQVLSRLPRSLQAGRFSRHKKSGSFRGWLETVLANAVKDHLKSRGYRDSRGTVGVALDEFWGQLATEDSIASLATDLCGLYDSELHSLAMSVKNDVLDWEWMAFFRTAVRKVAAKEVADQLGVSQPKVYQAKYKVQRRLAEVIPCPRSKMV